MDIGEMRFRLTLEKPASPAVVNELGETLLSVEGDWTTVGQVWAGLRPLTSAEVIRARSAQLDTTHAVSIRYYPGLTSGWRLRKDDAIEGAVFYAIKGVTNPDTLKIEHKLDCVVTQNA